jgi:uncharacterized membrane-anchored protein
MIAATGTPAAVPAPAEAARGPGFGKVPEIVLSFWIIKIAATTLGETGGDAFSMSLNLGYLVSTAIFAVAFIAIAIVQVRAQRFRPFLYWSVVVASTTVGTTLADFATRSLGIGYLGGSLLLLALLLASLATWWLATGSISAARIETPKVEAFYWVTILFSQTLGTALGDFAADSGGLGYAGGALLFGAGLVVICLLYKLTNLSRVGLFWAAFILTRPLGATVGDFLDKPVAHGGLALDRFSASAVLAAFIVACIMIFPQRAGDHPGASR